MSRFPHASARRLWLGALCGLAFALPAAHAQQAAAYPAKTVRLVIPAPPGGGTDALGRLLAEQLSVLLRQQVVPDNKPGASGVIASEQVARSPADGYTLMIVQNGHSMNPALFKKLPYDTQADFTPVATLARSPLVLIASQASGVRTVKEMVDLGRRNPAAVSVAVSETSTRLAVEMLSAATSVPMTAAMYKGTGPGVVDVAGGHIPFSVTTIASTLSQRGTGKVQFVAVLAGERASFLPEVPTLAEQGLSDLEATAWWGIVGPAGLPRPVVDQLHAAIRTAMAQPEVRRKLATLSVDPWQSSPEDFAKFIARDTAQATRLARRAGIEPE